MMEKTEIVLHEVGSEDPGLGRFLRPFKKVSGVSWENPPGTRWVFAVIGDLVVGVVAMSVMKDGSLRFKSDAVLHEFRGRGIYSALFNRRMKLAMESDTGKVSAYASPMSLHQFKKAGFKVQGMSRRGVAYVVKSL